MPRLTFPIAGPIPASDLLEPINRIWFVLSDLSQAIVVDPSTGGQIANITSGLVDATIGSRTPNSGVFTTLTANTKLVTSAVEAPTGVFDITAAEGVQLSQGAADGGYYLSSNNRLWGMLNRPSTGNNFVIRDLTAVADRLTISSTGAVAMGATAVTTLTANLNSSPGQPPIAGANPVFVGANSTNSRLLLDGYGGAAIFQGRSASGTAAAPSATTIGQLICNLGATGYGATAYSGTRAQVAMFANENWTDTAQGTQLGLFVTPNGSTTNTQIVHIDGSGMNGVLGATTPAPATVTTLRVNSYAQSGTDGVILIGNASRRGISTTDDVSGLGIFQYFIGRDNSDGLLYFNGQQPGFTGYVFQVDGGTEVARIGNSGAVSLGGAVGSEALRAVRVASTVNRFEATGAATGSYPTFTSTGSDTDVGFDFISKGAGPVRFKTNFVVGSEQVRITHTPSANTYITLTGAAAGGAPKIGVGGTGTTLSITSAGGGVFVDPSNSGASAAKFQNSNANYVVISGSASNPSVGASTGGLTLSSALTLTNQTVGTTVGAIGAASAPPALPLGYLTIGLNAIGNVRIPYYN